MYLRQIISLSLPLIVLSYILGTVKLNKIAYVRYQLVLSPKKGLTYIDCLNFQRFNTCLIQTKRKESAHFGNVRNYQ